MRSLFDYSLVGVQKQKSVSVIFKMLLQRDTVWLFYISFKKYIWVFCSTNRIYHICNLTESKSLLNLMQIHTSEGTLTSSGICFWWFECRQCLGVCLCIFNNFKSFSFLYFFHPLAPFVFLLFYLNFFICFHCIFLCPLLMT